MFLTIGQMDQKKCGLFGALSDVISAKNQPFFLHKSRLLRYFKRIYIRNWGMILGCKQLVIYSSLIRNPYTALCGYIHYENKFTELL